MDSNFEVLQEITNLNYFKTGGEIGTKRIIYTTKHIKMYSGHVLFLAIMIGKTTKCDPWN